MNPVHGDVAVLADSDMELAQELAARLKAPLWCETPTSGFRFILQVDQSGLALQRCPVDDMKPIMVDVSAAKTRLRRSDPLIRAMGKASHSVIDATAGFGTDSIRLALHGFQVTAIERCTLIYEMLRDALERRPIAGIRSTGRITVIGGDSRQLLASRPSRPDVIYLDPMYPPRRKSSALPRKETAILRELAGDDQDAGELLALARARARQRVVVKRPPEAPPMARPSFSIGGKLVRFDVYLLHA